MTLSAIAFEQLSRAFAANSTTRLLSWIWPTARPRRPLRWSRQATFVRVHCPLNAGRKCLLTLTLEAKRANGRKVRSSAPVHRPTDRNFISFSAQPSAYHSCCLQGYSDDELWSADDVRTHFQKMHTETPLITADAISQMEHPVLGLPFYAPSMPHRRLDGGHI